MSGLLKSPETRVLPAFTIMLREGLEAFLIVVIIAAYLRRTGRKELLVPMWIGVALAVAVSLGAGVAMHLGAQQLPFSQREFLEGVIGLVAVAVLTWMVFWMRRAGAAIKGELEGKLDVAMAMPGSGVSKALVVMAFFAVLREGLESALFMLTQFEQAGTAAGVGAVLGVTAAGALAYGLYRGSVHLDLRRFFTITGAVIIVFAAGLLATSLHQLHEAGVWNALQGETWDMSSLVKDKSTWGNVLGGLVGYRSRPNLGEVIVYWGYLIPVSILFFRGARRVDKPTDRAADDSLTGADRVAADATP